MSSDSKHVKALRKFAEENGTKHLCHYTLGYIEVLLGNQRNNQGIREIKDILDAYNEIFHDDSFTYEAPRNKKTPAKTEE